METVDAELDVGGFKLSQGSTVRKLKQSRLSFQVLSPETTNSAVSLMTSVELIESRKRKLSNEGLELGHITKIGRVLNTTENVSCSAPARILASVDSVTDEQKKTASEELHVSIELPRNSATSLDDGKHSKKRMKKRARRTMDSDKIMIKLPLGKRKRLSADKTKVAMKKDNPLEAVNHKENTDLSDEMQEVVGMSASGDKEKQSIGLITTKISSEKEQSLRTPLGKASITVSAGSVSEVDFSEEDIYMLCTPNSKLSPKSGETLRKLTPKQIARRQEYEKRQAKKLEEKEEKRRKLQEEREEKAREKEKQERQRRKEREEKDEQKRKEREEKEEIKRKEREEREEMKRKEREEKEKKRQTEIEQKCEEKRQKEEERKKKEEQKEEERKRKEEEKDAEEKRKLKVAQAFTSFFVKKISNGGGVVKASDDENSLEFCVGASPSGIANPLGQQRFMPFCVKGDMRLAPINRRVLEPVQKTHLEHTLTFRSPTTEVACADLYLGLLKRNIHKIMKTGRTWNIEEDEDENDDIMVVDETVYRQIVEDQGNRKQKLKAKFFLFEENRRPPFRGTWRKRSSCISARRPFAQDSKYFDYDVDSDEEWEEEEPGESLHGSDDEKDVDPEEDYEVDNEFFVPHGHLSDEELQAEEEGGLDDNSPEAQKAKLKIMQQEFADEMKKKTEKIKPRLIGCIWENLGKSQENDGSVQDLQAECSTIIWKMLSDRAMLYDADEPISFTLPSASSANRNGTVVDMEVSSPGKENEKVPKKIRITDEAVKDLVRLVHGNVNNRNFLVREFQTFWTNRNNTACGENAVDNDGTTMTKIPVAGNGVEFSLESIRNKIREIAEWGACPLEGPMLGKLCWTVDKDVLAQYDLECLNMPNDWKYHLKGNKQAKLDKKNSVVHRNLNQQKGSPKKKEATMLDVKEENDQPTKSTSRGASPADSITKFTKVLSKDDQAKQLFLSMNSPKTSNIVQNSEQSIVELSSDSKPSSGRKDIKKRTQLLMNLPRDQSVNQSTKSNLIKQFLENTSKKIVKPVLNDKKATDCSFSDEVIEIDSS